MNRQQAEPLMALSLREPWIWAILFARKNMENRRWPTKFRGRVVLHASKTWDEEGDEWLLDAGYAVPHRDGFHLGAYVGEVAITDCFRKESVHHSLWAFGPWCFTLEHPEAYAEGVPGRGHLGFWAIPPDERDAVIAAREAVGLCDPVLLPGREER